MRNASIEALTLAATDHHRCSDHLLGWFGDDVDDTVGGVGSPKRTSRSADGLDLLDFVRVQRNPVPNDEAVEVLKDVPVVDEDEKPLNDGSCRVARVHPDIARTRLRHVDAHGVP